LGRLTRLGVLGWPVGHSRSPAMHNAALAAVGLDGWRYQHLPVPPELFVETVRALPALNFAGANVTIPHKAQALVVADEATETARAIGAANTLIFAADGAIAADNTDAPGLLAALGDERPRTAVILGAGGAARAAAYALAQAGVDVKVWNRTLDRVRSGARSATGRSAGPMHLYRARRYVERVQGSATWRRWARRIRVCCRPGLPGGRHRAPAGGAATRITGDRWPRDPRASGRTELRAVDRSARANGGHA
jgi:shikimate 5-dehydrogenase